MRRKIAHDFGPVCIRMASINLFESVDPFRSCVEKVGFGFVRTFCADMVVY